MFSESSSSSIAARVNEEIKIWERVLSLRISIQKLLESANNMTFIPPQLESHVDRSEACEKSLQLLSSAHELLVAQIPGEELPKTSKKRKLLTGDDDADWAAISDAQSKLQPKWEETIDKWHSRLNFGTFEATSKMKTFKQSIWEQVSGALSDDNRMIEKSRMPLEDAKKLCGDLSADAVHSVIEAVDGRKFNSEIYDDRQFYSMLLKTFLAQTASQSNSSSLGGEDLAALRHLKRSKSDVDRKASKGRRIRFTVHAKLQSYMFPMAKHAADPNTDRLLQSLFQ